MIEHSEHVLVVGWVDRCCPNRASCYVVVVVPGVVEFATETPVVDDQRFHTYAKYEAIDGVGFAAGDDCWDQCWVVE